MNSSLFQCLSTLFLKCRLINEISQINTKVIINVEDS